jgi:hypothetical protein
VKPVYVSISSLRSALALVLTLWCAGTGCLAHGMAMAGSTLVPGNKSTANTTQADMAMKGHACCKARHRSLRHGLTAQANSDGAKMIALPEDSSPDEASSCCPLTSGSFVTTSRSQTSDDHSSAPDETVPNKQTFALSFHAPRTSSLRLPNHGPTYLTCCALLI